MKFPIKPIYAHCDGPCGHYETDTLKNSAQTCKKLIIKLLDLQTQSSASSNFSQAYVRLTMIKEEHAQICKQQIYILWSDYFKAEHYQEFPSLMEQLYQLAKQASRLKQTVDLKQAEAFLQAIEALDQIFKQTQ